MLPHFDGSFPKIIASPVACRDESKQVPAVALYAECKQMHYMFRASWLCSSLAMHLSIVMLISLLACCCLQEKERMLSSMKLRGWWMLLSQTWTVLRCVSSPTGRIGCLAWAHLAWSVQVSVLCLPLDPCCALAMHLQGQVTLHNLATDLACLLTLLLHFF